jgi:hypothetical protein
MHILPWQSATRGLVRLPSTPSALFLVIIGRIDGDAGGCDDTLIMKREM